MQKYGTNHSIKTWAEADRPREKLLNLGASNLSLAELLAIIIGSGSRTETALDLSKRILAKHKQDLHLLGKVSVKELKKFKGIGEVKAIGIVAALELGRRRQAISIKTKPQIKSSEDAYKLLAPQLSDLAHEEFWIIKLNRANRVISRERISSGGVAGTVVDTRIIFKKALEDLASSIILFHNHPSGNLKPSQADINITRKLKKAGDMLDIAVLDHLIISEQGYYSFADEGML